LRVLPKSFNLFAWLAVAAVAVLVAGCGGDDTPPGDPCTTCTDGVYAGEADPGGDVQFEIRDGHLKGTFDIVADTGCGRLPFELGNVYLDGEAFRSQATDDTIIEVTGQMTGADAAEGRYDVTWLLGEQTCSASGLWSATLN